MPITRPFYKKSNFQKTKKNKILITSENSQYPLIIIDKLKIIYLQSQILKLKMKPNTQQLQQFTQQVRRDILRMVHAVNSGHPGGSLGCAEFLVALYQNILDRKPGFDMDGIGEDLFFLSNGHISPVFYSVLARSGYFPVLELATFRKINTRLQIVVSCRVTLQTGIYFTKSR